MPQAQVTDGLTKLANSLIPLNWVIRTATDPVPLSASMQRELLAVDAQLAVAKIRTMEQVISESTARQNFNMLLLTIFAGLALVLAAIGIYGLMSYSVEQRLQELGIRMALGAGGGQMLKLVVGQGMKLTGIGAVVGLAAAFGLTRVLAGLLFGVKSTDPLTYAAVTSDSVRRGAAGVFDSRTPRVKDRPDHRPALRITAWRTHSCVPRSHSCERSGGWSS